MFDVDLRTFEFLLKYCRSNLWTIIMAILAVVVRLFDWTENLQDQVLRMTGVYLPSGCMVTFFATAIVLAFLADQLRRREESLITDGYRSHFPKGSWMRKALWSAVFLTVILASVVGVLSWGHQYRLPGEGSSIRIFIDKIERFGVNEVALEQRIRAEIKRELEGVLPEAEVEFLTPAPKGYDTQEERLDWACRSGASLVIYGVMDQYKFWPNVRICSRNVPVSEFKDFQTQVSVDELRDNLSEGLYYQPYSEPTTVRSCFLDSLAMPRVNYLALLSLGMIVWYDDIPHLTGRDRHAKAYELFSRAREEGRSTLDCELNYCWAVYFLGQAANSLARDETDTQRRLFLDERAESSYSEAATLLPDSSIVWYAWGTALLERAMRTGGDERIGCLVSCFDKFSEGTRLQPNAPNEYVNWGCALLLFAQHSEGLEAIQSYSRAFEKYAEAVRLEPRDYYAYYDWGCALLDLAMRMEGTVSQHYFEQSFDKFEQTAEINPTYEALYNHAFALSLYADHCRGRKAVEYYHRAFDKYDDAVHLNPNGYAAYYSWGTALLSCSRSTQVTAVEDYLRQSWEKFERSVCIDPNRYEAYNNWGLSLLEYATRGKGLEREAYYFDSFDKFGKAVQTKQDACDAYATWGGALCEYATRLDTESAEPYLKQSLAKLDTALSICPDMPEAIFNRRACLAYYESLPQDLNPSDSSLSPPTPR